MRDPISCCGDWRESPFVAAGGSNGGQLTESVTQHTSEQETFIQKHPAGQEITMQEGCAEQRNGTDRS